MKKTMPFMFCAAALSLALGCLPCYADVSPGKTKVATQEWVRRELAKHSIRIDTATVSTNVTTEGGATVTNITVASAFACDEVTNCVGIAFTLTPPALSSTNASGHVVAMMERGEGDGDGGGGTTVKATIKSGYWIDTSGNQHYFDFGSGWVIDSHAELPEEPDAAHVCQLDANCNCVDMNNTKESVETPAEYADIAVNSDEGRMWADIWNWLDKDTWSDYTVSKTGKVTYWVTDVNGIKFNMDKIGGSDAWIQAVALAMLEVNNHMAKCRDKYKTAHVCTATNPQHSWHTKTCGVYSWSVCRNNSAHSSGTEQHEFPGVGSNYTDSHHTCKCGERIEAHGTLVASGAKTPTTNLDGYETGWTRKFVCPKGCGYEKTVAHVHHFTDCGTCDAGDGCTTACTGCSGDHVFGEATRDKCAKCECPMCSGCGAKPPSDDETKHAGWMPCGEDVEEDNDDGTANGGHCQCECLTFGHNARTEHDYQMSAGLSEYEQITDKTAPARAKDYHYQILGQCTRCKQYKKQLEAHDWPETPTGYRWVSASVCAWLYECEKCQKSKRDETHGHELGSTIVYENVSASVCRQKKQCEHCKGFVSDDTHGHTRDNANGCKCANGCGYQFAHDYKPDACGNSVCSYCGAYEYGQETHTGYKTGGTKSAAGHQCLCGKKEDVAHVFGEWTETGVDVDVIHSSRTCTACAFAETRDAACPHASWSAWTVIGRGGGVVTSQRTCQKCGHVSIKTEPDVEPVTCDIVNDVHIPIPSSSNVCGCVCGKYGAGGEASPDEKLHVWDETDTDTNGIPNCMCKCGHYHKKRAWTTYQVNGGEVCPGVCSRCPVAHKKSASGIDAPDATEDDHTPVTSGKCGCKCGALDHGAVQARFHIRHPQSCRCYGANGDGTGLRHFKCPSACPSVCAYKINGVSHKVAEEDGETFANVATTPENHDWRGGATCGCKCLEFDSSNTPKEARHLHYKIPGTCYCTCRKIHEPIADELCPKICRGGCGGLVTDKSPGENLATKDDHTPDGSTMCGCQCQSKYPGQGFSGQHYEAPKWHQPTGNPACFCKCGRKHIHTAARTDCKKLCSLCSHPPNGTCYLLDDPQKVAAQGDHTFGNKCVCKCGKEERPHLWGAWQSDGDVTSEVCAICERTIYYQPERRSCTRDCDAEETRLRGLTQHDMTMHTGAGGVISMLCPIHNVDMVDGHCPVDGCEFGEGGSGDGSGGDGTGGGTGGSGSTPINLDDI